ncbi:Integrase family protein [Nostocoides japonicum T1-X7]|uniref:Integrase family protein n=1 Tax=Nostocoides japonicum T1-X7 TaxID=1194083 RepID=A0A077LYT4_9MICO|nr:site-specific integrase [Tetrasphaera japonica]CCH79073.1 Integrase family protein [Tetrasphaera japonica T1-X7]
MSGGLPPGLDRLPSGRIRARYRDEDGKQHSKTFTGSRAAQAWLRAQRTAVDEGTHTAPGDKTTVSTYAKRWTDSRVYRESSQNQRATCLRHLTDSGLGARRMRAVKPTDIQAFVADRSKVIGPQSMSSLYTFVKAIFAGAVEDRVIGRSPCTSKITLPKIERAKVVPLTVEQVQTLTAAMPERYRVGVTLQAALGLRISELLGLRVSDVDFLRRIVHVQQQLGRGGHGFGPLKTPSSDRFIPLAKDVVPLLSAHVAAYPPGEDGTIITTGAGKPPRQDKYSASFKVAVEKAENVPEGTTPHDLRHHFASVLLSKGVPVNVVADYLGHSNASLVLTTYGHLMPDSEDVVRGVLDSLWSRGKARKASRKASGA